MPRIQILKIDRARYRVYTFIYGNTGLARYPARKPFCIRNKYTYTREQGSPPT